MTYLFLFKLFYCIFLNIKMEKLKNIRMQRSYKVNTLLNLLLNSGGIHYGGPRIGVALGCPLRVNNFLNSAPFNAAPSSSCVHVQRAPSER